MTAADLTELRRLVDDLHAAASARAGVARGLVRAVRADGAATRQAAHARIASLMTALPPAAAAPFGDRAVWAAGSTAWAKAASLGPLGVRLGELTPRPGAMETLPALVDLLGDGHLVIVEQGGTPSTQHVQGLVLRALAAAVPGSVELQFVDPRGGGSLAAPFSRILSAGGKAAADAVAIDEQTISGLLRTVRQHVLEVQAGVLQGQHRTLADLLRATGRPSVPRRLVVISGYPHGFERATAQALVNLMGNGAASGVHVLMTVDAAAPMPDGVDRGAVLAHATALTPNGGRFATSRLQGASIALDPPPPEQLVSSVADELAQGLQAAAGASIPLAPALPQDLWRGDASRGLDVVLGYDERGQEVRWAVSDDGSEWATFIAGTAGSGKSNLIHTMLAGLAARYSPEECEMYLLDFKEGVELWQYGPGAGAEWLPHVRVVARATDRELGVDVLDRLNAEIKRRYAAYGDAGLARLTYSELRTSGHRLPRVVVVLDEFQQLLLPADRTGEAALERLTAIARLGRAAGFHLVLATQTLNGLYEIMNSLRAVLDQHQVRIALRLDADMSEVILGSGHRDAATLRSKGQAVLQRGAGSAHLPRIDVPFADPATLAGLRKRCAAVRSPRATPPVAFDGGTRPDGDELGILEPALGPALVGETTLSAVVGRPVAMEGRVALDLRPEPGNHVVVGGGDREAAQAVLQSAALSVAAQAPAGAVQFLLLDPVPGRDDTADALKAGLSLLGANVVHLVSRRAVEAQLERIRRLPPSPRPARRVVVVGLDMDVFSVLGVDGDDLAQALEGGPVRGAHGLLWWSSLTGPGDVLGYGFLERHLRRRVVLDVSADERKSTDFVPVPIAERPADKVRGDAWSSDAPARLRRFVPPVLLSHQEMQAWMAAHGVPRFRARGSVS